MENIKLNNGILMPGIGFGTWKIKDYNQVIDVVKNAIEVGYRHIDTASVYGNEEAIGIALKESCIPREDIFVTTKLWNSVRGYNETICAFNESLRKLQLEYIDLYESIISCPMTQSAEPIIVIKKKTLKLIKL